MQRARFSKTVNSLSLKRLSFGFAGCRFFCPLRLLFWQPLRPGKAQAMPNNPLHLTGAAILVSRGAKMFQAAPAGELGRSSSGQGHVRAGTSLPTPCRRGQKRCQERMALLCDLARHNLLAAIMLTQFPPLLDPFHPGRAPRTLAP